MLDLHVYMPETFDRQIVIVGMDHVHVFVYTDLQWMATSAVVDGTT